MICCDGDFISGFPQKPCKEPAIKFSRGIEGFDSGGNPDGDRLWPVCVEHAWEGSEDVSLEDGEVEYAAYMVHSS